MAQLRLGLLVLRDPTAAEAEHAAEPTKAEPRFNPYLAHADVKPPPRASNMRVAPPPLRRANRDADEDGD